MNAISTIFLLLVASICHGKPTSKRQCVKDTIDFATKVENSSIVVYGKANGIKLDINNRLIFNVTFEVDCILKGSRVPRYITITQAGIVENKTSCQVFPLGWGNIIAFLEQDSLNDSTVFTPTDFTEVLFDDDSTNDALANTCNLKQLVPVEESSNSDACPAVSINPICAPTTNKNYIDVNGGSGLSPTVIPGGSQLSIDSIRSKSVSTQIDVDTKTNGANSINISILLLVLSISFVRSN
ncbi:unnamed protein product [Rotaria magnacalcarata]|uniref:Uncharacterized protein n=3 Tax=Rotaria magnacalcarata TaxID=392030 RepID=A0A819UHJ2_9BILA|nr:unnamed protein product [Rotaria magnacalcarata]CAF2128320.1 unnamed protein product [Rotaria magnacalcarata]CAF4058906.1 unnamed protein product [Rotaria magnacalcarata]CAF4103199.1 unnamed protein product [Rotaria magnacalcarata]